MPRSLARASAEGHVCNTCWTVLCRGGSGGGGSNGPSSPSSAWLDRIDRFVSCAQMASLACCAAPRWSPSAAGPLHRQQRQPRRLRDRLHVQAQRSEDGQQPEQPPAATPPPSPPPPLTDPAGMVVYGGRLPPARRLVVSGLTATAIGQSLAACGSALWWALPRRAVHLVPMTACKPCAPSHPTAPCAHQPHPHHSCSTGRQPVWRDQLAAGPGWRTAGGELPPRCPGACGRLPPLPGRTKRCADSLPPPCLGLCCSKCSAQRLCTLHPSHACQGSRSSTPPAGWRTRRCTAATPSELSGRRRWTHPAWRGSGQGGRLLRSQLQPTARPAARVCWIVGPVGQAPGSVCAVVRSLVALVLLGPSAHFSTWLAGSTQPATPSLPTDAGEENISVVVAPIRDGFTLQRMGSPEEAAQRFLDTTGAEWVEVCIATSAG